MYFKIEVEEDVLSFLLETSTASSKDYVFFPFMALTCLHNPNKKYGNKGANYDMAWDLAKDSGALAKLEAPKGILIPFMVEAGNHWLQCSISSETVVFYDPLPLRDEKGQEARDKEIARFLQKLKQFFRHASAD